MDCSPPDSSVHGILQSRTLEWGAMPSSRGSSQPRDQTQVSLIAGGFFTVWTTGKALYHIGFLQMLSLSWLMRFALWERLSPVGACQVCGWDGLSQAPCLSPCTLSGAGAPPLRSGDTAAALVGSCHLGSILQASLAPCSQFSPLLWLLHTVLSPSRLRLVFCTLLFFTVISP